jgi:hypothetical protein
MPKLNDHYAILVAINWYPGIGNLKGPENDAAEFKKWLMDDPGGNLDERNIRVICSSDFVPLAADPYDANPTETQFKKALNGWLKPKDDWLGRVGERLYLFFAGHGFTAGSISDPALFTAQAQLGDTVHIAGLRYASKIQNAGFFDEIVLVMDCCQDVLKAAQVGEPTWAPPDRQRSSKVKLMQAYGAPRGSKAFESSESSRPVHGYFSSVLMDAIRTAPDDAQGFVTARAVEETFYDIWAKRYLKLTGYEPSLIAPRDMRLYRRNIPAHISLRGPNVGGPNEDIGPQAPGPVGPLPDGYVDPAGNQPRAASDLHSSPDPSFLVDVTIASRESGAQIRIIDAGRHELASGVGRLQIQLRAGPYTARSRVGDEVHDRPFKVDLGDKQIQVELGLLKFSSPIPLDDTSTHHEYHYYPAMELSALAAERASETSFPDSVGTLIVFARDSAHEEFSEWLMLAEMRTGLRLRRLDEETGAPHIVPCEPVVNGQRGYCSLLLNDLAPGTYLLGVRRLQRDYWSWQEIALTVASSWWRTEVYLDSMDDDWTGRRFDVESASVLITPGKGSGSLFGSDARFTEVARLALTEGRLGVDENILHWVHDLGMPEPMLALYTAYALTLSPDPDTESIHRLCEQLRERWTKRSADVKLLEMWCLAKDAKSVSSIGIEFKPDEVPIIARGWELSRQLGSEVHLPLGVQYHVGTWRTCGSLWTQTQVPDTVELQKASGKLTAKPSLLRAANAVEPSEVASMLGPPNPTLSPLQQALRRAVIDAAESGESTTLEVLAENAAAESGLDFSVVRSALDGILVSSSINFAEHEEEEGSSQSARIGLSEAEF